MGKTDEAVRLALKMADDPTHGYDQAYRWGPDYDCSSFLITVWERVGVPLKSAGATYTGNMKAAALSVGFVDVTNKVNTANGSGLQLGDILLHEKAHTAMFVGNGNIVHASINENGTITGGKTGDQTGKEISVRTYYNGGWNVVLRYGKNEPATEQKEKPSVSGVPKVRSGDTGEVVRAAQFLLNGRGFSCGWYGADGDFGPATEAAVLAYQRRNGLDDDGIIGPATWAALLGV